ncbi:heptaprenyl diphosphate synthase component 1 [Gorillibacterium timonense]|uniref:heptaprenyl diphosphate synthase component 1 n=1 Tax=Gorillibacterium timonense TaxID=1689269 RepID=UPI00071E1852|nr:heptaprenyl diphosphate synthase component 1 [Gorillibacterium timonense]
MTITHIEKQVKRYTEYDVIQTYTDLPDFPEFRVRLLYAFLNETDLASKNSELYSLVTAIVQMGLDTHDQVPEHNTAKTKPEARSRQLKVLAGDYFSSRYYNLLAEAGEVTAVRLLAASVCEINRLKLNFYTGIKQMKITAEDYIHDLVQIKSHMFLSLAGLLPEWAKRAMTDLVHGVARFEVLNAEMNRLKDDKDIPESWAYWHILDHGSREDRKLLKNGGADSSKLRSLLLKYKAGAQLQRMLEEQLEQLSAKLRELSSERLLQELQPLTDVLNRYIGKPRILEER